MHLVTQIQSVTFLSITQVLLVKALVFETIPVLIVVQFEYKKSF